MDTDSFFSSKIYTMQGQESKNWEYIYESDLKTWKRAANMTHRDWE